MIAGDLWLGVRGFVFSLFGQLFHPVIQPEIPGLLTPTCGAFSGTVNRRAFFSLSAFGLTHNS